MILLCFVFVITAASSRAQVKHRSCWINCKLLLTPARPFNHSVSYHYHSEILIFPQKEEDKRISSGHFLHWKSPGMTMCVLNIVIRVWAFVMKWMQVNMHFSPPSSKIWLDVLVNPSAEYIMDNTHLFTSTWSDSEKTTFHYMERENHKLIQGFEVITSNSQWVQHLTHQHPG